MTLKALLASAVAIAGLSAAASANAYSSDYTLATGPGGLQPAGTYANLTNPYTFRTDGAWGSYLAPSGAGTFEVVNGAGDAASRFYYDTVNLIAGTPYTIGADMVDNYSASAPVIQLMVDGVNVGPAQTLTPPFGQFQNGNNSAPPVPGPWKVYDFTYVPTVSGSHVIAFVDLNTDAGGNDFSFDPMTSGVVPEPAMWALMGIGLFGMGGALRGRRANAAVAA